MGRAVSVILNSSGLYRIISRYTPWLSKIIRDTERKQKKSNYLYLLSSIVACLFSIVDGVNTKSKRYIYKTILVKITLMTFRS